MIPPFDEIRKHYEEATPKIFSASHKHLNRWYAPYSSLVEWRNYFSPIEWQAWQALRSFGKVPMYPQYPVDKFFIDFGNPVVKVGIECDGKEWHLDEEKDARRDNKVFEHGWHIFRISGSDCLKINDSYHYRYSYSDRDRNGILDNFYETIEGLLKAISIFYFGSLNFDQDVVELQKAFACVCRRISKAQFPNPHDYFGKKYQSILLEYLTMEEKYRE